MQNRLKEAFKETPDRFRYTIETAIVEAEETPPKKRRLSKGWRIALAVILILAIIPTAIFGASKIIENMTAEKYKNYGIKISAASDPDATYPEYVKMHVTVPDGFAEVPNTDGLKYYNLSTDEPYTDGFSLDPFRPDPNGIADIADFANGYEACVISGHTAYKIIPSKNYSGFDRIYVYYEDVNVMLLIYYKDVTEQQLTDFIEGVTVTEGTAADHTDIGRYNLHGANEKNDDVALDEIVQPDDVYIEKPLDTVFSFASYDENENLVDKPVVTCKVTGVRAVDNISKLDPNDCNNDLTFKHIADESGNILPHIRERWDFGDGISTVDKLLDSAEVEQKLLLVDFVYTNLTNKDRQVYIPWGLRAMVKDVKGQFRSVEIDDQDKGIGYSEYCASEIYYMSRHGEGKSFYSPSLKAGETTTITVGFLVDADMLDKFYLIECPSADEVYSPSYPTDNPYTYFLMKVL